MLKKLQKSDYNCIAAMIGVLIVHLLCIIGPDHFADESFFPSVPIRLINGESLVSDDWHVTQFASIFTYVPVRFWLAVKGSTEGIILFLRFFYLAVHTTVSVGIYAFFRKYKLWAVAAAVMYYSQVPLRFMSANYHSLLVLFLLLLTIALLLINREDKLKLYLFAGFCYGCCCICNPFECLVFPVYIIACLIWCFKPEAALIKRRKNNKNKKNKKRYNKKNKTEELPQINKNDHICNRYLGKAAFVKFSTGLLIAVVTSVAFFFITNGSLNALVENIPNMLNDGSHDIFESPIGAFVEKIEITFGFINDICFGLPWLLPLFYFALLVDKKRQNTKHKTFYIVLSFALSIFFFVGVVVGALNSSRCLAITLPFAIASTVCYVLTENKNKKLFYCMWLPSAIATFVQYLASDMHLSVMWALTIGNIAGIFFIKDFISENAELKAKLGRRKIRDSARLCSRLVCGIICAQFIFQCGLYVIGRIPGFNSIKLEKGPYKGIYVTEDSFRKNNGIMNDLDAIKVRSSADDPVLIISEFSWMYLYIDRPFATYSAWQPFLEEERLKVYYDINPQKRPKYIYIGFATIPRSVMDGHGHNVERAEGYADTLKQMFSCDEEKLSNGILLTVKD